MMNDFSTPRGNYGTDDWQDFADNESIDDIARSEGFFIDDDGHWLPLEMMPGYDELYEEYGSYEDFSQDEYDEDDDPDFDWL